MTELVRIRGERLYLGEPRRVPYTRAGRVRKKKAMRRVPLLLVSIVLSVACVVSDEAVPEQKHTDVQHELELFTFAPITWQTTPAATPLEDGTHVVARTFAEEDAARASSPIEVRAVGPDGILDERTVRFGACSTTCETCPVSVVVERVHATYNPELGEIRVSCFECELDNGRSTHTCY